MSDHRPDPADRVFRTLIEAYHLRDYVLFRSLVSDKMQGAVSQPRFERASRKFASFFASPHASTYLGAHPSPHQIVHSWNIAPQDEASKLLVRMGINDNRVSSLIFSSTFPPVPAHPEH